MHSSGQREAGRRRRKSKLGSIGTVGSKASPFVVQSQIWLIDFHSRPATVKHLISIVEKRRPSLIYMFQTSMPFMDVM
jgi:hypothetical protein